MTRGFFITGTDTGVGKTVIAGALILIIKHMGCRVCGMKPIETGCMKSENVVQKAESRVKDTLLIPADGMFLKEIADMDDSIDIITPIRFENPLAPFPASEIEGTPVDIEKIKKAFEDLLRKYDMAVIEGIGGLLVPLNRNYFVLDLIKHFGLPIVIVSRPGLGTINHTLLTVNYAIKEGINVAGIIMNYSQSPEKTLAEETNPKVIRQISPVPLIGIFPYLEDLEKSTMEQAAVKTLNLEIIRNYLPA
ncbi:MAG TPA: dethiobiotin synthase [Thermodesulfovibrionales bacterium]|nr:dethiobiotin synthase [Thermodesulfovibrionales bacterium]